MNETLRRALGKTARYYDERKVGDVGALGFRRSTPLEVLNASCDQMILNGLLVPGQTRFLDMGCADGRVNVFFSYLARLSVGVEIDEWTLDEYEPLKSKLESELASEQLPLPPDNLHLFHGDTLDDRIHELIQEHTGTPIGSFDVFFTYLTMYKEFAALIRKKGRSGAVFMIYGLDVVLPQLEGFTLLKEENRLALYEKE